MPQLALIGLGSNVGDRRATLDRAVAALGQIASTRLHSVSSYHETEPVGGPSGQGAFCNAAALLETSLDPRALLDQLHRIEQSEGRERIIRWGERTLDLDLLLHGQATVDDPCLTVPHPRMAVRRFVLAPAVEIAPRLVEPRTGRTLDRLLANLDRRPTRIAILAPPGPRRSLLMDHLATGLAAESPSLIPAKPILDAPLRSESGWTAFLEAFDVETRPKLDEPSGFSLRVDGSWYDQFAVIAQRSLASNPCRLLPFLDAWKHGRKACEAPTFVVFWDPPSLEEDAVVEGGQSPGANFDWASLVPAYREHLASQLRSDPVLHVRSFKVADVVEEAVAAFAASRG